MKKICLAAAVVLALFSDAIGQSLFSDDFNDGNADGWTQFPIPLPPLGELYEGGTFDASSGGFQLSDTVLSGLVATADGTNFADGVLTFDMVNDTEKMAGGMVFRWNSEGDGYLAELIRGPTGLNEAALARFDDGVVSVTEPPLAVLDIGWVPNETYRWTVNLDGPQIAFDILEVSSGRSWSGSGNDSEYAAGSIGGFASVSPFDLQAPYGVTLDNINFSVPEPGSLSLIVMAAFACVLKSRRSSFGKSRTADQGVEQ